MRRPPESSPPYRAVLILSVALGGFAPIRAASPAALPVHQQSLIDVCNPLPPYGAFARSGAGEPAEKRPAVDSAEAQRQYARGEAYYYGRGSPLDKAQAAKWFLKAAKNGHPQAQYFLGRLFDKGDGVALSEPGAVLWYRKAAEQGEARAQSALGTMYSEGAGVPQDDIEAVKWWEKAAAQGDARGLFKLGGASDGAGDYGQALLWYLKAARLNYACAENNLGIMYERGHGVPINLTEASRRYRRAAELGLDLGQYNLAAMYEEGQGVPRDLEQAKFWYRKAADQGYEDAQSSLKRLGA